MSTATILRADARALPLPDASVDLIVTSPPYFALRSYTDGGEHYDGQIGAEATPREYIASLIACTREWMRVLKPSGSIWVNLGDKYNSAASGQQSGAKLLATRGAGVRAAQADGRVSGGRGSTVRGVPNKSLMMLPERYRIACVDELGLIARAVVVWSKPNGLPESVTDRVRRSHEDWVHLTRQPRYYSAVDEIREPTSDYKGVRPLPLAKRGSVLVPGNTPRSTDGLSNTAMMANPLGKLPGSVWEIPTEPLTVPDHLGVDHFAAFPTEWPRRIILGWSPSGICTKCGEGRRPVVTRERRAHLDRTSSHRGPGAAGFNAASSMKSGAWSSDGYSDVAIIGDACACPDPSAPTRPAVVLDPFGGTGTTSLVAKALGRHGISVDMSADYCRLATWRTTDPGQLAKAMRVEKPPVQADGQADLFADLFGGAA